MTTRDCVFCDIVGDPVHQAPIYRDERVIVVKDINPKAPIHLLIIPNIHLGSLA